MPARTHFRLQLPLARHGAFVPPQALLLICITHNFTSHLKPNTDKHTVCRDCHFGVFVTTHTLNSKGQKSFGPFNTQTHAFMKTAAVYICDLSSFAFERQCSSLESKQTLHKLYDHLNNTTRETVIRSYRKRTGNRECVCGRFSLKRSDCLHNISQWVMK